jgi:peptidyl-prolyl cis-trans isomerase A (cyclophilin A)
MSYDSTTEKNVRCRPWPYACVFVFVTITAFAACNRSSPKSKPTASDDSINAIASTDTTPARNIDLKKPEVQIDTTVGPITVRLDAVRAPGTVQNFLNYVNDGFYTNTIVHYVDPGKMIVAGGYSADRKPKPARTPIRNEAHNGLKNVRGTIAMARNPTLIDSATSQFFINLADAPQRDHQGNTAANYGYCVFGVVTEGLNIADRISKSSTTNLGGDLLQTPNPPVVINSIRVVR